MTVVVRTSATTRRAVGVAKLRTSVRRHRRGPGAYALQGGGMERAKSGKRSPKAAVPSRIWGTIVREIRSVRCRLTALVSERTGSRAGRRDVEEGRVRLGPPIRTDLRGKVWAVGRASWKLGPWTVGGWLGRTLGWACGWQRMSSVGPDSKTGLLFGRGPRRRSSTLGNYCALDRLPSDQPCSKIAQRGGGSERRTEWWEHPIAYTLSIMLQWDTGRKG